MTQQVRENLINVALISTSAYGLFMTFKGFLASLPIQGITYASIRSPILTGLVVLMNSLFLFFFLTHRPQKFLDKKTSKQFIWAYLGSYLPFYFGFTNFVLIPLVDILIGMSVFWALLSVIKLGKSTDIVVANRGIVSDGSYAYVRHPLYSSYLFTNSLYMIITPFSLMRTFIYLFWIVCIFMRIYYEEQYLLKDMQYKEYCSKVKYKLIPGIW